MSSSSSSSSDNNNQQQKMIGAIEAGGTSFVVSVFPVQQQISTNTTKLSATEPLYTVEFPTTTPDVTLARCVSELTVFKDHLVAIGIACFGPLELNESKVTYGYITSTPKPHWQQVDVVGVFKTAFPGLPIGFDTDVNAAALAEIEALHDGDGENKDATEKIQSLAYITVGTGVGVGIALQGGKQLIHGLIHPEAGHLRVQLAVDDTFEGACPFHGPCVEGLVAAGSIATRLKIPASALANVADTDPVWDLVAFYLAQLCTNITYLLSIERIILGGGVLKRQGLLQKIHLHYVALLNGYLKHEAILQPEKLLFKTQLTNAGALGAAKLGVLQLLQKQKK